MGINIKNSIKVITISAYDVYINSNVRLLQRILRCIIDCVRSIYIYTVVYCVTSMDTEWLVSLLCHYICDLNIFNMPTFTWYSTTFSKYDIKLEWRQKMHIAWGNQFIRWNNTVIMIVWSMFTYYYVHLTLLIKIRLI